MEKFDLNELLEHIDPVDLDYSEWTEIGQALKLEGYPCYVWENWSMRDPNRYHEGECRKKWASFKRDEGVTGGTIYHIAIEHGWSPVHSGGGRELSLNDSINYEGTIVGEGWAEHREFEKPKEWNPAGQLIQYLETLFTPDEIFGYVMDSFQKTNKDGVQKYVPANKGVYTLHVGEIIDKLKKNHDIEAVLGKYNHEGGAWIRFNPLDGNGVNNENVTDFRYALIESDNMSLEEQNGMIRQLKLPAAVIVYSGSKSVHAIVHIDADDIKEYQKRVNYLYDICKKNGMVIDTQNRNPSRLSRMPGCERGDKQQFIIDTNVGFKSYNEWKEWIEAENDDLPDIEDLSTEWDNLPPLAPELIQGVLREGHKMLIAGPSKAGKSFDLIELTIAIAEGSKWHGWQCEQGRVMYVNLELDRASCLHRFKDVYAALGMPAANVRYIDVWNLRGRTVPMNELTPKLIRRAKDKKYKAIIIDPIYKVITGDENSAEEMAKFCNEFDKIATSLGAAIIYCHHHSKGAQGGKVSMDRASGSGVFARDPDAMLDMIELPIDDERRRQKVDRAVCNTIMCFLKSRPWSKKCVQILDEISPDDALVRSKLENLCDNILSGTPEMEMLLKQVSKTTQRVSAMTAWRIEGTLREFPKFKPINCWFKYPIHLMDEDGSLEDINPEVAEPAWKKANRNRKSNIKKQSERDKSALEIAFTNLELSGKPVSINDLASSMKRPNGEPYKANTIRKWVSEGGKYAEDFEKYVIDNKSYIRRKNDNCEV